jgi:hypothetical protein
VKTIKERWERYSKACYPEGMQPFQEAQLHQAWFACAFEMLACVTAEVAALPDDDAVQALKVLQNEAEQTCRARAHGVQGHN